MELAHEVTEGIAVVTVSGEANRAPDRHSFHEYVKSLIAEDRTLIVIDFSSMSWIGSNLLGALIACYCSLRACGGGLCVIGAGPKIVQAIAFNQLTNIIPVEPSVESARASLLTRPSEDPPTP